MRMILSKSIAVTLSLLLLSGCNSSEEETQTGITYYDENRDSDNNSQEEGNNTSNNTEDESTAGTDNSPDYDRDGVADYYDQYPQDPDRISERGYKYESWDKRVTSVDEILNSDLLSTIAQVSENRNSDFDLPTNVSDNFVQRVRAYIVPDETADYYFYVAADDGASVWLSDDAIDNGEDPIIELKKYTGHNNFKKYASQKSKVIHLEAGKPYYLEVIAFEGSGGDNLSLAWSKSTNSGESTPRIISSENLQQYYFPTAGERPPVIIPPIDVEDKEACAKQYFTETVKPLLSTCVACHTPSGIAKTTKLVLKTLGATNDTYNYNTLKGYIKSTGQNIIKKNNGAIAHAGGAKYDMLKSVQMDKFIDYIADPSECQSTVIPPVVEPPVVVPPVTVEPPVVVLPPVVTLPPAMEGTYDKDGDGVFDVLDLFPDDASRIGENGFYRETWSKRVNTVADAIDAGVFDTEPNAKTTMTDDFDAPVNVADYYVQRARAYIKPLETADYYLYVAVDDGAKVYLSTDADASKKELIIETEKWTSHNNFKNDDEHKSKMIRLESGNLYYVEVLAREGGGGDNLSLGYSTVSNGRESSVKVVAQEMIESFYMSADFTAEDFGDADMDGIPNYLDADKDNDGVLNDNDLFPLDPLESADTDEDGLGDNRDTDDDNDGVADSEDEYPLDASKSDDKPKEETLNTSVIQAKCVVCHYNNGPASFTNFKFKKGNTIAEVNYNETELSFYITGKTDGGQVLLEKSRGLRNHGGGATVSLGSTEYKLLSDFIAKFSSSTDKVMSNDGTFSIEPKSQTYRRASLYLTGEIPTQAKLQGMDSVSDTRLRSEILDLMKGEGFHNFLKDGANDRLHSRHLKTSDNGATEYNKFYKPNASDNEKRTQVRQDLAEEPLELIAYVVENDLPYSEILTADYTMVSQYTDESYNTGLNLSLGEWRKAKNRGQDMKTAETYGDDATGNSRITDYPHAGVLSTWAFLSRYPTTATNRNRTRANWTMQHFLGYNIEKSAARTIDIAEVEDEANPIMNNAACTSCHQTMDPIAGAYKYFHERVGYKAYGTDSLDGTYRKNNIGVNNWYHDVLPAGYRGMNAPSSNDPLQWLAKRLVEDYRFAESVVKFWWLPVFGENVLDSESADREHFDTQSLIITALANDFRDHMNLKQLLTDMVMSDTFRAEKKVNASIEDSEVSLHMGARHLLSPRALKNKTESLTRFVWGNNNPKLDKDYYMLYGGIDDIAVDTRPTDLTNIMFKVAERQALELGCAIVLHDFDFDQDERRLFTEVERETLSESDIKRQIVVLFERMLNRRVGIDSQQVEEAYMLFLELQEAHKNQGGNSRLNTSGTRCDNRKSGSDNDQYHVLAPWRGLVTALMSDPDYLYE